MSHITFRGTIRLSWCERLKALALGNIVVVSVYNTEHDAGRLEHVETLCCPTFDPEGFKYKVVTEGAE